MNLMEYIGIGGMAYPAWSGALLLVIVWSLFWKGFALWFAAKRNEKWWFIAFLVLNTIGILEIVYIFFVAQIPEFRKKFGLR